MQHTGLAKELAKATVDERRESARRRHGLPTERARSAREGAPDKALDRSLSLAGALSLLALVVLGPTGIALAAGVAAVAIAWTAWRPAPASPDREWSAEVPEASDPWLVWRTVEPDAEFLRDGPRRTAPFVSGP
jgi:hypothetical protein